MTIQAAGSVFQGVVVPMAPLAGLFNIYPLYYVLIQ